MRPPCKKAGVDCPRRCPGCQTQCQEYQRFRAICDQANAKRRDKRDVESLIVENVLRVKKRLRNHGR